MARIVVQRWPWPWNYFNHFGLPAARREGALDGRGKRTGGKAHPPAGATVPMAYPREVLNAVNDDLKGIAEEHEAAERRREGAIKRATTDLARATQVLKEVEEAHPDHAPARISPLGEGLLLTGVAVADLPVNAKALEVMLLGEVETLIFAALISLLLVGGAFLTGRYLRTQRPRLLDRAMTIGANVLVLAVMIGMAYMRNLNCVHSTDSIITLALAAAQTLGYVVAAWITYAAHDPVAIARRRYDLAKKWLDWVTVAAQRTREVAINACERVMDYGLFLAHAYESENVRWREDDVIKLPVLEFTLPNLLKDKPAAAPAQPNGRTFAPLTLSLGGQNHQGGN